MDAPTQTERPSRKRGALVLTAVLADFAWVSTHVRVLGTLGLADGDPMFYAAYQAVRSVVAGSALAWALRSGWFERRELGLERARQGRALRWLAKVGGGVLLAAIAVLALAWIVLPALVCDLVKRALGAPPIYPWSMFVRDTLCMVLLAPVYEEIVYRALLLSALREHLSDSHALVIGGGVFLVLHYLYGYGWNTAYLLVAVVLGWIFLRTASIFAAMMLHAASNLWFTVSSYARHTLGDAAILDWFCAP